MSSLAFDKDTFSRTLHDTPLASWADLLSEAVLSRGHALKHGHLPRWEQAVSRLPPRPLPCEYQIVDGSIHIDCSLQPSETDTVRTALKDLCPWRKGPFQFDTVHIDTEWRSDWKWDRLAASISPLGGRKVLDVGCGSGYHLWRMHKAGAALVLGIDPSLLYLMQFNAAQHFIQQTNVQFLPLSMETLPAQMHTFDTVFSMGVLYHRRDPLLHLTELRQALDDNGELVIETLVIPGDDDSSLLLDDRYANMRNIYELPTVNRLCRWLSSTGFHNLNIVSVAPTSRQEQRSTAWMPSHSLAQALDPENSELTIEGHPRPLRAIITAQSRK